MSDLARNLTASGLDSSVQVFHILWGSVRVSYGDIEGMRLEFSTQAVACCLSVKYLLCIMYVTFLHVAAIQL